MRGVILGFSESDNLWLVSGENNERYYFELHEWKSEKKPIKGDVIDFSVKPENFAYDVYLISRNNIKNFFDTDGKIGDLGYFKCFLLTVKQSFKLHGSASFKEFISYLLIGFIIFVLVTSMMENGTEGPVFLLYLLPFVSFTVRVFKNLGTRTP